MPTRIDPARVAGAHARWLFGICAVALLAGGCTWYSLTPRETPAPLPATADRALDTLVLGEPRNDALDCSRQECNHWYRLDVPHPGTLAIELAKRSEQEHPIVRLLVQQIGNQPLAQTMGDDSNTLSVHPKVHAGLYMVLVQAAGTRLEYTLSAHLDRDPP